METGSGPDLRHLILFAMLGTILFISKQAFYLPEVWGYSLGAVCFVIAVIWFVMWKNKYEKSNINS